MEKERKDFIFRRGVLGWGIPFWLTMSLWYAFKKPDGGIFDFGSFNLQVFYAYALISLPLSLVGGFFWGLWGFIKKAKG